MSVTFEQQLVARLLDRTTQVTQDDVSIICNLKTARLNVAVNDFQVVQTTNSSRCGCSVKHFLFCC